MGCRKEAHNNFCRFLKVMIYRKLYVLVISLLVLVAILGYLFCPPSPEIPERPAPCPRTWSEIRQSDTLRAVTIPSSYAAFQFKGEWHGHEYNNVQIIAKALGLELEIVLVKSEQAMVDSLFSGAADVAIWPMSHSVVRDYWFLLPTGPRWSESQCIVSDRKLKLKAYADSLLTDSAIATLPHYRLSIVESSRQWLTFFDDSVRLHYDLRPFVLDTIPHDSLSNEQLTDSLIMGKTEAVMLRCNEARLMHDYYPSLVLSDTIPFSADSVSWMVTSGSDTLRHLIDSLTAIKLEPGTPQYRVAPNHYRQQKLKQLRRAANFKMSEGGISIYDNIFRAAGEKYEIDWRLLAGIAYIESNFNHAIVSTRGPLGLMQLMPQTAKIYGYTNEEALDPEINVDVAAQLYSRLQTLISNRVPGINDSDLICFTLAAYNAGLAHVYDAIALADTLGYKVNVWEDNVEHCLRLKYEPQYYKMPVVKQGKFNGAFTINYVNEVTTAYQTFCSQMPIEKKKKK